MLHGCKMLINYKTIIYQPKGKRAKTYSIHVINSPGMLVSWSSSNQPCLAFRQENIIFYVKMSIIGTYSNGKPAVCHFEV